MRKSKPDQPKDDAPRTAEEVNKLIQQRQQKVQLLREAGANPYRNDFRPEHTTADVLRRYEDQEAPEGGTPDAAPLSDDRFSTRSISLASPPCRASQKASRSPLAAATIAGMRKTL